MSKYANAGELRTPVLFMRAARTEDDEGFSPQQEENVFGQDQSVRVKWVNAHGSDSFIALQMQLREPATITCRYSSKITPELLVYRVGDPAPYEVISIDNVEQRNQWLEIKIQRKVKAR